MLAARLFIVMALLVLGSGKLLAAEAKALIFVATPVQNGLSRGPVLLPRAVDASGASLAEKARALFEALRRASPKRYEGLELLIPDGFDLARRASLRCPAPNESSCAIALAEVGLSLRAAGVDKVRLEGTEREASLGALPIQALAPVVPFWSALPPNQVSLGLVQLGSRFLPAAEFYEILSRKNPAVAQAARQELRTGFSLAQVAVARNARVLGVDDARALMALLDAEDPAVRAVGLEVLAKERSSDFLARCEKIADSDPDPGVKSAAVRILVDAGRSKYKVYLLLDDLKLQDEARVRVALKKLTATGDPRIGPAILPLLAHSSATIREEAADALVALKAYGPMAEAAADAGIDSALRSRLAREAAEKGSGPAQARALAALHASGPEDRAAALRIIAKGKISGQDKAILAAIESGPEPLRLEAARAAAAVRLEAAVEALAPHARGDSEAAKAIRGAMEEILASMGLARIERFAGHANATVRAAALRALGRLGSGAGARGRAILVARLEDDDLSIKKAAVDALSHIADAEVANRLLPLADDPDPEIRASVLRAVVAAHDPKAPALARKALTDPDDGVKLVGVESIRALKVKEAMPDLWKRLSYGKTAIKRAVLQTIVELSTPEERRPHLENLAALAYDPDPTIKSLAAEAIGSFREPLVFATLGALVRDRDQALQIKALKILGQLKDPRSIEYVVTGLLVEDRLVKLAALDTIAAINSMKAEKPLQEFITNEGDPELKRRATEVLDGLTGD